jgi:hypothetical protein
MYHDPCHTPMKLQDPLKTVNALVSTADHVSIEKSERCCGESGTFAIARPDIATQVRFRKEREVRAGADRLRTDGFGGEVKILTSCPSCLQGLKRYNDDADIDADYLVRNGPPPARRDWLPQYVARANAGESNAFWSRRRRATWAAAVRSRGCEPARIALEFVARDHVDIAAIALRDPTSRQDSVATLSHLFRLVGRRGTLRWGRRRAP